MASNEVANILKTGCLEMKGNGYHLIERREETLVDHMTIVIHSRSIDDRSYAVQWYHTEGNDEDRKVETEMTQEEVQRFEEDWCTLWKPVRTKLSLTENLRSVDHHFLFCIN